MSKITAATLICGAASTPLLAGGSRGGAAQPPLNGADFSVFSKDDTMELFLLVGQSNMKGRGVIDLEPETNARNLFFHAKQQQWFVSRDPLHASGTPDLIDGSDNAGTGPGMSFAMTLLEACPEMAIGLIPAAVGGAPINSYKTKLYDRSLMLMADARKKSPLKTEIKAILWLQGESDATESSYTSYEEKLLDLVDRYREDLKNPDLPFIACTIGSFIHPHKRFTRSREINEILLRLPSKRKHTACVDARDLTTTIGDKLHYSRECQVEIGKRFAATYLKLQSARSQSRSPCLNLECGGRGEARAGDAAFRRTRVPFSATPCQHDAKAVSTSCARKLASDSATALQVSALHNPAET